VGQAKAVQAVSDAVRRSRAGISDPDRPTGSFLFLGPTGVGKTELAKALAEFLFDDERAVVRIDMSEYSEKHSVARLVGAPPGYVGYEAGGQLTEAVRRRPYCVILLDEVEKAHQEVFDIILFDALTTEELAEIVDLQAAALARRLAERRLTLHVTPAAREWLALTGFDPVFGARPLRRLVQSAIGDQLARALLSGQIVDGDTVLVDTDADADALTVTAERLPATSAS